MAKPLRHPGKPSGRRASLNDRVATLTKALRLDPQQQAELRTVLQGQREQVQRIWNDETMSSGDRLVATKGVGHRTADQIRALLNEEQRKKFDPAPEHDPDSTVGKANVEEWMKRR